MHCRLQTIYWKNAFSKRFEISTYTFYLLLHLTFHMLCWLPKHTAASFSSAVLLSLLFPGAIVGNLQLCSISSFETASPHLQLTIKLSWLFNEEISLLGYLQNQLRTRWNLCCVRCSLSAQQQFSSHLEKILFDSVSNYPIALSGAFLTPLDIKLLELETVTVSKFITPLDLVQIIVNC